MNFMLKLHHHEQNNKIHHDEFYCSEKPHAREESFKKQSKNRLQSSSIDMLFSQTFAITFPKNETQRGILDQTANLSSGLILFKGPRISERASYAPTANAR